MGKKILVVDDALFMRRVIRKNLEGSGYQDIEEACSGEKALELFSREKLWSCSAVKSLILCSWILPCRGCPGWRCWRKSERRIRRLR